MSVALPQPIAGLAAQDQLHQQHQQHQLPKPSPNNISTKLANSKQVHDLKVRAWRQNLSATSHHRPSSRDQRNYYVLSRQKQALQFLTLNHKDVFDCWTGNHFFWRINQALREDDANALRALRPLLMSLRRAIVQRRCTEKLTLYRGTSITESLARAVYTVGASFLWPEFTASSLSKTVARQFAEVKGNGYVVIIQTPGIGTSYYTKIPPEWSQYPMEKEVLIYPYSGIVVTGVDHAKKEITVTLKDTHLVESEAGAPSLGSAGPIPSSQWPSGAP